MNNIVGNNIIINPSVEAKTFGQTGKAVEAKRYTNAIEYSVYKVEIDKYNKVIGDGDWATLTNKEINPSGTPRFEQIVEMEPNVGYIGSMTIANSNNVNCNITDTVNSNGGNINWSINNVKDVISIKDPIEPQVRAITVYTYFVTPNDARGAFGAKSTPGEYVYYNLTYNTIEQERGKLYDNPTTTIQLYATSSDGKINKNWEVSIDKTNINENYIGTWNIPANAGSAAKIDWSYKFNKRIVNTSSDVITVTIDSPQESGNPGPRTIEIGTTHNFVGNFEKLGKNDYNVVLNKTTITQDGKTDAEPEYEWTTDFPRPHTLSPLTGLTCNFSPSSQYTWTPTITNLSLSVLPSSNAINIATLTYNVTMLQVPGEGDGPYHITPISSLGGIPNDNTGDYKGNIFYQTINSHPNGNYWHDVTWDIKNTSKSQSDVDYTITYSGTNAKISLNTEVVTGGDLVMPVLNNINMGHKFMGTTGTFPYPTGSCLPGTNRGGSATFDAKVTATSTSGSLTRSISNIVITRQDTVSNASINTTFEYTCGWGDSWRLEKSGSNFAYTAPPANINTCSRGAYIDITMTVSDNTGRSESGSFRVSIDAGTWTPFIEETK